MEQRKKETMTPTEWAIERKWMNTISKSTALNSLIWSRRIFWRIPTSCTQYAIAHRPLGCVFVFSIDFIFSNTYSVVILIWRQSHDVLTSLLVYLFVCGIRKNALSFGNGFAAVLMLTSDSRRGRAVVTVSWLYSFCLSKYYIVCEVSFSECFNVLFDF